jgi:predicted transporter
MKRSELTNKQKLFVPCPICAAAIGEHCQMYSGLGRRNEPHAERKYQAVQAAEQHGMVIRLATPIGTRST